MTPFLAHDIESEEGRRLTAYRDSVGVNTIGVGHTQNVKPGQTITDATADGMLAGDIQNCIHDLDRALPWWRSLDDVRQDVMVQFCFQLGIGKLQQFTGTLSAVQRGDYALAGDRMLQSLWAKQTPQRARRMAMQMKSGVRAWARATQPTTIKAEPEQDI